uniref:Heat shock protein 70 n=1 Tax=Kalanchoe fedtschenkoi TaxID=63787 RepID=A0A7N0TKK9_KALFE
MAEPAYTVASDSETIGEEKSPAQPDIAIGIDIGTSQCSVAFWNGSEVELLKNSRNQKTMRTYVSFKDENPSAGVTNQLNHEKDLFTGSAIFNLKRLIGRVDTDPVVHASKTLPFLVQTLDIEALITLYEGDEDKLDKNHLLGYFKVGIPPAPKGTPEINICLDIDASNVLRCLAGVVLPGSPKPVAPIMEIVLPMVDDGHGWCAEALKREYGSALDMISLRRKM